MNISFGTKLGRYEIRSKIGEGGMGEVYLAEDTKLDRKVALKILPSEFAEDKDRISRFVREAKSASALNHPNIITIHEFGTEGGTHFLASEFIDGETLRTRLKREPLTFNEALDIAMQTAQALAAAHEARIIHRDIKPENVMIRRDGIVKVLDFGLAKLTERDSDAATQRHVEQAETLLDESPRPPVAASLTLPGMVMGTVAYMSPEQARGQTVDTRTDLFSLGVMLYEMLTCRQPFTGVTVNHTIVAILEQEPPPLASEIPDELVRILKQALAKQVDERYTGTQALLVDLKNLQMRLLVDEELGRTSSSGLQTDAETQILAALPTAFTETLNSIAVLPFTNMSTDGENEYFCDGLAEELLNALSKIEDLKVAARTSAFSFKGKDANVGEIGEKLNVRNVVDGSVRRSGNKLRISIQLVNVSDGFQLWSESYDREMQDIFELQDEIALAVVDALKLKLLGNQKGDLLNHYTDDTEAHELYLKGRFYWNRRTEESLEKAIEQFKIAKEKDPNYALAYGGLADCYLLLPEYVGTPTNEALSQAKAFAERAIAIAPRLGEPYVSLGMVCQKLRQWVEAEAGYRQAIELSPGYATAYQWYSSLLRDLGRTGEAAVMIRRAQEIDPLSSGICLNVAITCQIQEDFDASAEHALKVLELDPNNSSAYRILGRSSLKQGRLAEAVAYFEKGVELSRRNSNLLYDLGFAYGVMGKSMEAIGIARELEERYAKKESGAGGIASVYAGMEKKDEAFEWLEKGCESNEDIANIRWSFPYESLRSDPRYKDLLKRIGLPE